MKAYIIVEPTKLKPRFLRSFEIASEMSVIRLRPGEIIFREGDRGDSLYLVGEGSVKISRRGRGGARPVVTRRAGAGGRRGGRGWRTGLWRDRCTTGLGRFRHLARQVFGGAALAL